MAWLEFVQLMVLMLGSGGLGSLLAMLITSWFNRHRVRAESARIIAETVQIEANAEQIEAATEQIRGQVTDRVMQMMERQLERFIQQNEDCEAKLSAMSNKLDGYRRDLVIQREEVSKLQIEVDECRKLRQEEHHEHPHHHVTRPEPDEDTHDLTDC